MRSASEMAGKTQEKLRNGRKSCEKERLLEGRDQSCD